MPTTPKPAHLNPPKQGRSQRTLERIVAASLELLATEGPAGLTVHAVVEKAESSVGSFYARFNGKDDLLDYLGERVWADAAARWNEALVSRDWGALTLPQIVEGSVVLLIDAQRSRSAYLKALDWATGRQTDAYETFRSELLTGLSEILLVHAASIDHHDPQLAVRLGLRAVLGVIDAESRAVEDRLSREALVGECRTLLLGYLMSRDGPRSPTDGVEYFDVWG
ncbi:MAG: TetR/AcrR family transcriptional regulator [Gemmatimonadetes bacterium]|nr:TetR/AcrR family transcriptional regulator [Gemmatimonadota bacterium]MDA1102106.1 TetR/AcrR family transcriptional regulator [Gemmatimonadota bacterium]